MIQEAYLSGQYKTWTRYKSVGVSKFCRKINIKGLQHAISDRISKVEIKINNKPVEGYELESDTIRLAELLPKGNYKVEVKITYNYIESARYTRY